MFSNKGTKVKRPPNVEVRSNIKHIPIHRYTEEDFINQYDENDIIVCKQVKKFDDPINYICPYPKNVQMSSSPLESDEMTNFILDLLEYYHLKSPIYVDLGAKIGSQVLPAAVRYYRVWAVEPFGPHAFRLYKAANMTEVLNRVHLFNHDIDRIKGSPSTLIEVFEDIKQNDETTPLIVVMKVDIQFKE